MKQIVCSLAFTMILFVASSQQVDRMNPDGINKPATYSQVVRVNKGTMVFTSGIVSDNEKGEIIGKGDLKAQTKQCFENLKIALAAVGGEFKDVVKLNYYVVNYDRSQVGLIREVRSNYLDTKALPASTLAGVQALFHPDVLIEIEAIAVVPKKKKKS
jgi:enamine deaminase RidA (YjgF/YER057c/UK114 family)